MLEPSTVPFAELVYVTLNPATVLLGLVQDTVRDVSVMLLNSSSVGGSGPGERHTKTQRMIS